MALPILPLLSKVEGAVDKLAAQLTNQGLGHQFTDGIRDVKDALSALKAVVTAVDDVEKVVKDFETSVPLKPAPSNH